MTAVETPLAALGARPAFDDPLHVGRPGIGNRRAFMASVDTMLSHRWFTNNGPFVRQLEAELRDYLGVRHCVLVTNGTVALSLLARACGLRGEVIVPSFTFVATAHALDWLGIVPVFCDIDETSWTLDPVACAAAIGPATEAILGVHLFGRPCDTAALGELARAHDLHLFFDASHAFGCTSGDRMIGTFGEAEVFSLHATKTFHTFEGGAVATDNAELADAIRLLRNFGFTGFDEVASPGINAKMPEICAAMGLSNLEAFDRTVAANRATFECYRAQLADIGGLAVRDYPAGEKHNWQYVVLEIDHRDFGLDRDSLIEVLRADNVLARRYFFPGVHAMEPYRTREPGAGERLSRTLRAAERALVLPAGAEVSAAQVQRVCAIVRAARHRAAEIRAALGRGNVTSAGRGA